MEPTPENAGETHDSLSRAVNAQKSSRGDDVDCQSGSVVEARAELRTLANKLPPPAVRELLAVARALAADHGRDGLHSTLTPQAAGGEGGDRQ